TNTGPDVQDLYVEKVDPADPSRYLTPDGSRPFETRREVIKVKGRPDEVITVRTTRHGPVISDINANVKEIAGEGHVIAFAWTALAEDDLTAQSGIKMMAAETTPQFIEALRDFHAPQQNVVFADIDGNIGFYAPGRVPVRKPEHRTKGLMPAPGWEAENDWDGYIPFEELPQAFNPADGVVMTANHKVVPDDYKHHITHEWTVPFRARRITQLLDERPSHSIDSFRAIQIDSISLFARDLLPLLLAVPVSDAKGGALQALLRRWDGKMDRNRPEGLVFHAWARELARALYEDDLGPLFEEYFETRPIFLLNALTTQQHWCDDIRTPAVETCADMIRLALDRAGGELRKAHGDDPARWRWGDAHPARSEHRPLGKVKSLRRFFDIRVPADGDTFTVNAARFNPRDPEGPFTMIHGASFRAIYDLDDLDRSIFIQSSGQSGNPLSKRFADFALPWSNGEYLSMSVRPVDYEAGAIGVLQLVPR
ncbi:MAG: penicillin acylase family protein, partial [Alphaproteobacteria bacterium]|nr:penicillin acylase family protein [Alphaproteobacteria bacterium]